MCAKFALQFIRLSMCVSLLLVNVCFVETSQYFICTIWTTSAKLFKSFQVTPSSTAIALIEKDESSLPKEYF